MSTLVTGAAGFIGYHTTRRLLERGHDVVGIDNLNDYYDVSLKEARLQQLYPFPRFRFELLDIADRQAMASFFVRGQFDKVVHLAAQAGVRYSIDNPHAYIDANVTGFLNVLEGCRHSSVGHLLFASSSSVYGANRKLPFAVTDRTDHPMSLYAATKKVNEVMAHTYSHLYNLPTTGVRFFTVYGPWGRPDMAPFKFIQAILAGDPIPVFNHGKSRRDFTYIEDAAEAVARLLDTSPALPAALSPFEAASAPHAIYNIGSHRPIDLMEFIETLEQVLGTRTERRYLPAQPGDVDETFADVSVLDAAIGFRPSTPLFDGLRAFADWYVDFYRTPAIDVHRVKEPA